MKSILLLTMSLFLANSYAQISLDRSLTKTVEANSDDFVYVTLTNTTDSEIEFFWDIVEPDGSPVEWQYKVCDTNTCYDWDTSQPCDAPAKLLGGETYKFSVYLKPNGQTGVSTMVFRLLTECDAGSTLIGETNITWNVSGASSTKENLAASNIVVYPNPTVDRFQINEDADIARIALYNIIGKNVQTEKHYPGKFHDVSELQKGIYLVRLIDKNNDVIKVIRLTRK